MCPWRQAPLQGVQLQPGLRRGAGGGRDRPTGRDLPSNHHHPPLQSGWELHHHRALRWQPRRLGDPGRPGAGVTNDHTRSRAPARHGPDRDRAGRVGARDHWATNSAGHPGGRPSGEPLDHPRAHRPGQQHAGRAGRVGAVPAPAPGRPQPAGPVSHGPRSTTAHPPARRDAGPVALPAGLATLPAPLVLLPLRRSATSPRATTPQQPSPQVCPTGDQAHPASSHQDCATPCLRSTSSWGRVA
jgi:hypothetical protein